MTLESGIVLPVPEAEPIVGELRTLHDPQARFGVPAHITLLYPFAHASKVADSIDTLHQLFSRVPAFEFSLVGTRRFPETAYLHPEPTTTFIRLIDMLVRQWPEFPPYGGAFSTVTPHLTVAQQATPEVLDAVDAAVSVHLPIVCGAKEAWLLCSDEHGFWSVREVFRFLSNA
ncbi:MAG TPA: 2'-5' RNA ligase family protein [Vicinamibacterales bacterium]|nr:2'-5' RNA ligase family protein [Vicinamibacterales bacterium]